MSSSVLFLHRSHVCTGMYVLCLKTGNSCWLSARKKFRGGDNRPLFFKTIGYCSYCYFYCFSKILGGQTSFRGGAPPCSRKPACDQPHNNRVNYKFNYDLYNSLLMRTRNFTRITEVEITNANGNRLYVKKSHNTEILRVTGEVIYKPLEI